MEEPFDTKTARKHVRAILTGPGMTVFTKRVKEDLVKEDMRSGDAVNVVRGGTISALGEAPGGWRYQAATDRMVVEFSFRGHAQGASGTPAELVLESARREKR